MASSLVGSSLLKFLREGLGATTFPANLKEIVLCSQSVWDKKFFNNADIKENVRYSEKDQTVYEFYKNFIPRIYFNNPNIQFRCNEEKDEAKLQLIYDENRAISVPIESGDSGEALAKRMLNIISKESTK